jgi:inorganic phosphate transporter, PiT family
MGAISWNLITWWLGIPSSNSHALIGGLAGAGFTKAGFGAIVWTGLGITSVAIVLSALFGFILALLIVLMVSWILEAPQVLRLPLRVHIRDNAEQHRR